MQWYYVEDGQQAGPVDEASLSSLVQQGRINAQTLVWSPSMTNWQPYGEVAATAGGGQAMGMAPDAAATATATTVAGGSYAYCTECGRDYPPEEMLQYGGAYVCPACKPIFFQKIREGVTPGVALRYAGFWIRFRARLIDSVLLLIINALVQMTVVRGDSSLAILGVIFTWAFPIAYYTYFHGSKGQTLGKMALGIRVVYYDGAQISYARALGRHFAEILSSVILAIGYIMAAFDDQKRALHDRICDTRVIHVQK